MAAAEEDLDGVELDESNSDDSSDTSSTHSTPTVNSNKFANDGSFLDFFKRQMESKNNTANVAVSENTSNRSRSSAHDQGSTSTSFTVNSSSGETLKDSISQSQTKPVDKLQTKGLNSSTSNSKSVEQPRKQLPFVGKRRGAAPVLKTGAVKKVKKDEDILDNTKSDPWSKYMAEVKKYKEKSCQDEDKTRPLVK